ncbi:MAK10-like protein [Tanacetum coccineum]
MLLKCVPRSQIIFKKTNLVIEIGTPKPKEPEQPLEEELKDLHLNLPVLEVLAHAPMYNAILDKYVESLELGKNGSVFILGEMPKRMKDPGLFTLPCRLGNSKPFDTLADLGSCVNLIPLYLFKKLKIRLLEETDHIFGIADGTKSYPIGIVKNVEVHIGRVKEIDICDEEVPYWTTLGKQESYELRPSTDEIEFLGAIPINPKRNMWESGVLVDKRVDWNKPPKGEDGAWHIRIELITFILAEYTPYYFAPSNLGH